MKRYFASILETPDAPRGRVNDSGTVLINLATSRVDVGTDSWSNEDAATDIRTASRRGYNKILLNRSKHRHVRVVTEIKTLVGSLPGAGYCTMISWMYDVRSTAVKKGATR